MNRKYTTEDYAAKIQQIRDAVPDIAITTDVIVGFPQETDEEFEMTRRFIEEIGYSELHVFPYSKRKNTPAARMPGQVPENVKHDRVHVLLELSRHLHEQYASRFIGRTLEVIFEEVDREHQLIGHASNYLKVKILMNPI